MKRLAKVTKDKLRQVRHARIRARVLGTAKRPRLSVFRGLRSLVVQIIDDEKGKTLCYADSKKVKGDKKEGLGARAAVGYEVGKLIALKAKEKNIEEVIFDRGGYKYHGRVKAVAEGAREGGLKF